MTKANGRRARAPWVAVYLLSIAGAAAAADVIDGPNGPVANRESDVLVDPVVRPVEPVSTATPTIIEAVPPSQRFRAAGSAAGGIGDASVSVAVQTPTAAERTPTTFAVTSTGAASYTIPIWTPPAAPMSDAIVPPPAHIIPR